MKKPKGRGNSPFFSLLLTLILHEWISYNKQECSFLFFYYIAKKTEKSSYEYLNGWRFMSQNLINELYRIVGKQNLKLDEPMTKHTTFRIGGPAQYFVMPQSVEELGQVIQLCRAEQTSYFIVGHGSNLLVSDSGISGVVIQLDQNLSHFSIDGTSVRAMAGVMLGRLGLAIRDAGLTGFEFAAGIPGTLGGAIMMNAGAYGGEMKDIVTRVQLMDADGNLFERSGKDMDFSYRHSAIEGTDYVVIGATLMLEKGNVDTITERMEELAQARRTKQPLEYPSAGSTFKRPEGYFAGKLIMDAGLAGYQVGGAQISEKHCGFVINRGGATARDVMQLIEDVRQKVYEKFQVELEPEVRLTGDR